MISGPVYQAALKRLAAIAMAVGTTTVAAAEELATIPERVAETLILADERDGLAGEDRMRLLQLLALDPRPAIRARIAEGLAMGAPTVLDEKTEALLERLAVDPSKRVRESVVSRLQRTLPHLSGLERSSLVGRWATSSNAEQRQVIARVLHHRFPLLWVDAIVDHLMLDPVAAVRKLARHAAEARGLPKLTEEQAQAEPNPPAV